MHLQICLFHLHFFVSCSQHTFLKLQFSVFSISLFFFFKSHQCSLLRFIIWTLRPQVHKYLFHVYFNVFKSLSHFTNTIILMHPHSDACVNLSVSPLCHLSILILSILCYSSCHIYILFYWYFYTIILQFFSFHMHFIINEKI